MDFLSATTDKLGKLKVQASGDWTAANANSIEHLINSIFAQFQEPKTVEINIESVLDFDTYGAWLLHRIKEGFSGSGAKTRLIGLDALKAPLLEEVAKRKTFNADLKDQADLIESPIGKNFFLESFSGALENIVSNFSRFFVMLGAILSALGRMILNPRQYRLTSTIHQFDRVCWKALPIVLMVTFIIGAIIAQQGFFHFKRFGADLYVVDMIGFLLMREIGVLLVAIVIAGRSGSSYTAELGSMKMREEIDALKTMGFNPVDVLLLPRVLVLVIALPVLTFIGSIAALLGAGLVATTYAGMTTELFLDRLNHAITMDHFWVGLIKAPFIGLVIGVIACYEGLQVKGSATSLGKHTTQSVVKSIFMVIVLDGLFALFFSAIGM